MAVDKRDKIFPEDSLVLIYECRVHLVADNYGFGQPAEPVEAFVRILDKETGEFIPLGDLGEDRVPIVPIPKNGDTGALLKYTIGADVTHKSGDYTAYVTAVYDDETQITEDRDFKVLEFS